MPLLVEVGGFIFTLEERETLLQQYASVLREVTKRGERIVVVTGGGELAREFSNLIKILGGDDSLRDEAGILATRLHALLFLALLKDLAYPAVPKSIEEAVVASKIFKVVVVGGMFPGQSTDAVAAVLAERTGAKLIVKCTSVDAVYDRDPTFSRDAKRLKAITHRNLLHLLQTQRFEPGYYELFDPVSLRIAERSGISIFVMDGRKPANLLKVISGEINFGTLIKPTDGPVV